MLFTKSVFKLTPLIITTLVESCRFDFKPATGPTLDGFENMATKKFPGILSEIKCKLNDKVTACSNLNSNADRADTSNLFGGFASHGNNATIDFIFGNFPANIASQFTAWAIEWHYSRGMYGTHRTKVSTSCEVDLLFNGEVISSVPAGVLHSDSKENMTSSILAVKPGDVVSIREVGHCAFVLGHFDFWPLKQRYDSSKNTSYVSLTGQPVSASSQHQNHGPEKAVDDSDRTYFTSNNRKTKERGWFKVTIPDTVPGKHIVGFQIHNRRCCLHHVVNVDVYLLNEKTGKEIRCGRIGREGDRKVVSFVFDGDCVAPRGGHILKLLASMNYKETTEKVLSFKEIRLAYQDWTW